MRNIHSFLVVIINNELFPWFIRILKGYINTACKWKLKPEGISDIKKEILQIKIYTEEKKDPPMSELMKEWERERERSAE